MFKRLKTKNRLLKQVNRNGPVSCGRDTMVWIDLIDEGFVSRNDERNVYALTPRGVKAAKIGYFKYRYGRAILLWIGGLITTILGAFIANYLDRHIQ